MYIQKSYNGVFKLSENILNSIIVGMKLTFLCFYDWSTFETKQSIHCLIPEVRGISVIHL